MISDRISLSLLFKEVFLSHLLNTFIENVWHPYYEIKMEEEDIKDKFLRNKAEKIMLDMQNTDIKNI